ncbi:S8 family serine peptidase [Clostridium sp. 1xD42-85]|nr:hypothetical protein [Roseburia sp. 1XD42-34]RKI80793.1 hypothetical protein D7V87_03460 [Clostridium sp. 1xD42-85]
MLEKSLSGTSFATAHITGVIAKLLSTKKITKMIILKNK